MVPAAELGQASGDPVITAIEDRGGGDIPSVGRVLPVAQDGVAVIGETLLVRGRHFGRQPTVAIAGKAATVVSRTEDGGILLRVPPGVPAGSQRLSVAQEEGRGEHAITVRRMAVARDDHGLTWLDVGATTLAQVGRAELSDARAVVFSPDGRAAYALDKAGTLHVFEMPAAGVPALRGQLKLPLPVRALLSSGTQRLVVLGEAELHLVDLSTPLYPVRAESLPLPLWARGTRPLHAALSPDGRRLALALPEHNRLVVVALSELRAGHEPVHASLPIAPEILAPVLADLTFAPDGKTLWLVSGVTAESRGLGPTRTRVHAVRLNDAGHDAGQPDVAVGLTQARVVEIEEATRPVAIVTGRAMPLASGAAIRLPPERATVHVAAYGSIDGRPSIFSLGADDAARTALTDRQAGVIGRPEVSPDETWLLSPSGDAAGGWRVLGVPPASGTRVEATRLALGAAGGAATTGTTTMEIRVQP